VIDCDIRDRVSSEDGCDGWLSYVRIEKFDANQTKYIVAAQQKIQAAARWYGPIGAPITLSSSIGGGTYYKRGAGVAMEGKGWIYD